MLDFYFLLPILNLTLGVGSVFLLLVTLVLAYDLIYRKGSLFGTLLQPYLWPLIIGTTVSGVVLSLVYSELFNFVPCSLCWLQRIALYPQALIAILAWRHKDVINSPIYGIGLSIFGLLVAIYQYIYQAIPAETRQGFVPCLADGSGADCATKVIDLFGFVTFPFISAVTFAFLITLYCYLRKTAN